MELVNLMYRYVNRFINSNELIKELKKIYVIIKIKIKK